MIPREKLGAPFPVVRTGPLGCLMAASAIGDEQAALGRRRRRRENGDDLELLATRVELLVGMGELSFARKAFEGAELAPKTNETLQMLSEVTNHFPEVPF